MSTFSTNSVSTEKRASFVQSVAHEVYGGSFSWLPVDPEQFWMDLSVRDSGNMMLARHRSSGFSQANRPRRGHHSKRRFALHAAISGEQLLTVEDLSIALSDGEFTLLDTAYACEREQLLPAETIVLAVPEEIMRRDVPNFECLINKRLSSENPLCSAIIDTLRSASSFESQAVADSASFFLSATVVNLLALLAGEDMGNGADHLDSRTARIALIKSYVDENLSDPDLSVARISRAVGISSRYVHMLFATQSESLPEYIRRRRLSKCAHQLQSELFKDRSITDIAYSWGFNDLSHFCRMFRSEYGVTARSYRSIVQEPPTPEASSIRH